MRFTSEIDQDISDEGWAFSNFRVAPVVCPPHNADSEHDDAPQDFVTPDDCPGDRWSNNRCSPAWNGDSVSVSFGPKHRNQIGLYTSNGWQIQWSDPGADAITVDGDARCVSDGNCFSSHDGAGASDYPQNYQCTFTTLVAGVLRVETFSIEADGDVCASNRDHLTIGGTRYCGSNAPGRVLVGEGESFEWKARFRPDSDRTPTGFRICVDQFPVSSSNQPVLSGFHRPLPHIEPMLLYGYGLQVHSS